MTSVAPPAPGAQQHVRTADADTRPAAPASRASRAVDRGTAVLGLLVLVAVVGPDPVLPEWPLWSLAVLAVLACRWSLMVPTGSADSLLVGLEPLVLLLLGLHAPPSAALTVWAVAVVVAELLSAHTRDTRLFNGGVRVLSGAAAIGVLSTLPHDDEPGLPVLLVVLLAATAYFVTDYAWSCASISAAEGTTLRALLQPRGLALALLCSTAINSTAFLAHAVLHELHWVGVLLLVPFAALLLASHSWSTMRRAEELAAALSTAAVALQQAEDEADVERLVVEHARRVARAPAAELVPSGATGDPRLVFAPQSVPPRALRLEARHSAQPYSDQERQALGLLLQVARQEHERRVLLAQLRHAAAHDSLTGLVNRRRFELVLDEAVRSGRSGALLYGDLDGFKQVNDLLGHAAGDALLVEVAGRLRGCVREGDVCGRLGGDEFVVLLSLDADRSEAEAWQEAEEAAERVRAALARPYAGASPCAVSASVGLVLLDGSSADTLLHRSDAAMYDAKAAGGGLVRPARLPRALLSPSAAS